MAVAESNVHVATCAVIPERLHRRAETLKGTLLIFGSVSESIYRTCSKSSRRAM